MPDGRTRLWDGLRLSRNGPEGDNSEISERDGSIAGVCCEAPSMSAESF
jgi:hypothetical protein